MTVDVKDTFLLMLSCDNNGSLLTSLYQDVRKILFDFCINCVNSVLTYSNCNCIKKITFLKITAFSLLIFLSLLSEFKSEVYCPYNHKIKMIRLLFCLI